MNWVSVSKARLTAATLAAMVPLGAMAQAGAPTKLPTWDVISVKLNKALDGPVGSRFTPDGFHAQRVPLRFVAARAYGVNSDLVLGIPKPLDGMTFDIDAKVAVEDTGLFQALSEEQRRDLVKAILSARFGWQAHLETKEMPVYELVVAKGGPKLQAAAIPMNPARGSTPGAGTVTMSMQSGVLIGKGMTMTQLANGLAAEVQRNVIDKTGIPGNFDVTLRYKSERFGSAESGANGAKEEEMSLFTALTDQLGLKLQPAKGPVKTVVAGHAEAPAEN